MPGGDVPDASGTARGEDASRAALDASVVVPCRDAERWIAESLRSAAAQTCAPREVLVVDDGSRDGSLACVASVEPELARRGVALRVLRVAAGNAAAARNAALEVARGRWVAFLDADDRWDPDHLARARARLEGGDPAYLAGFNVLQGARRSTPPGASPASLGLARPASGLAPDRFVDLLSRGLPFGHSTVVYRLDRAREVGGFEVSQRRRHDIDLWLRVVAGRSWSWDPGPDADYRVDVQGSVSCNVAERTFFMLRALVRSKDAYPGPGMQRLLRVAALNAARTALTRGAPADRARARELAWPLLRRRERLALRALDALTPALQPAVRLADRLRRRP